MSDPPVRAGGLAGSVSISVLLGAGVVALAWVGLFQINAWVFAATAVSEQVSWVFLPAALRMLAVMLLEWTGVLGIIAGSAWVGWYWLGLEGQALIVLSALSGLGPMAAYLLCRRLMRVPADLTRLSARQLLVFAVVGAATTSLSHQVYWHSLEPSDDEVSDLIPMFVGDLVGTLLVLYLAAFLIRLLRRHGRTQRKPI